MWSVIVLSVPLFVGPVAWGGASDWQDPPARETGDPALRDRMNRPARPAEVRLPATVEFVPDVVYATTMRDGGEDLELTMNVFFPKDSGGEPLPVVIYLHGGGWTSGDKSAGDQVSAVLAAGGYFACTVSYRLVHEARFPAAIHDVKAAVRFIRANAEELGIDPQRIGVWGHSAGGHLASYLGTTGNAPETDGQVGEHVDVSSSVACVVSFFGPADLTMLTARGRGAAQLRTRLFGEDVLRDSLPELMRLCSPISFVDADDPPFLFVHGSADDVVPPEQSRVLHESLKEHGVASELIIVQGARHGFRDADSMIRTAAFFDDHLGGRAASVIEGFARSLSGGRERGAPGARGRSEGRLRSSGDR